MVKIKYIANMHIFLLEIFENIIIGIYDGLNIVHFLRIILKSKYIRYNIKKCLLLNFVIFLGSIICSSIIIKPLMSYLLFKIVNNSYYFDFTFDIMFYLLWIIPTYIISLILSSEWYNNIVEESFLLSNSKNIFIPTFAKIKNVIIYSIYVNMMFVAFTTLCIVMKYFYYPYGTYTSFFISIIFNSFYIVELSLRLHEESLIKRVEIFEKNCDYFLGFGLLFTILTTTESFFVSYCYFSILLPFMLINTSHIYDRISTNRLRIKLFMPVLKISDALVSLSIKYVFSK